MMVTQEAGTVDAHGSALALDALRDDARFSSAEHDRINSPKEVGTTGLSAGALRVMHGVRQ